jgi:hypothetical protein
MLEDSDNMPEGYRHAVRDNPLMMPVASGYLDIKAGSVEAIFTLPIKAAPA